MLLDDLTVLIEADVLYRLATGDAITPEDAILLEWSMGQKNAKLHGGLTEKQRQRKKREAIKVILHYIERGHSHIGLVPSRLVSRPMLAHAYMYSWRYACRTNG
jgi:hypothetical protein